VYHLLGITKEKRMKRVLSIAVVFALAIGLFAGCGGGDQGDRVVENLFENTYDGEYFTIQYPNDYKVEKSFMGTNIIPEGASEGDGMNSTITVDETRTPELKKGDIAFLKEKTEGEMGETGGMMDDIGLEEVDFAGYKALSMKLSFLGMNIETYAIPFDGWTLTVAGSYMDDDKDLIKKMLSTFNVTNENYEGSTEFDFDFEDDEDTDTDDEDLGFDFGTSDQFEEKYEGSFFKIGLPEGAEVTEMEENGYMFTCNGFDLVVMAEEESDYEQGNIQYVKDEVEEEIASGEIHTVEDMSIDLIYDAVWFEGDSGEGQDMVVVIVPLSGWMVSIYGSNYTNETKEDMRTMIRSMEIPDMFYMTNLEE